MKNLKFFLVFIAIIFANLILAQSIPATNGLTNCAICAPPGWSIILGTPDVSDRFKAAATGTSGGGTDWVATPLPLPPNGHNNWLSLRDLGPSGTEEIVGTTMTGLILGRTYELTIYTLTAQAPYSPVFNDEFRYKVGTGPLQTINPITQNTWGTETIIFTATGTSESLELYPGDNSGGSGSFESVQISVTLNAIIDITDTDGDGIVDTGDAAPSDPCDPPQASGYTGYDATNPIWSAADCDSDGVLNGVEDSNGSDPYDPCDPDATDTDGDGICDNLEANNGTDPLDACDPNSDGDWDMDGICNKVDLDDDNDGVPDELESPSCSMAELQTFNWLDFWMDLDDPITLPPSSPLDFGGVTLSLEREDPDAIFLSGDIGALNLLSGIYKVKQNSVTGAKKTFSKFKFSQPVKQLEFAIIDIDSNATYQDNVLVNAYFNGSIYNITPSDFSLGTVVRYDGANKFIGSDVTGLYPEGEVILNFPGLVDSVIVEFSNSDPFPFATQTIGFRFGTAWCNANDTDGDGVPDLLDLDSDNDGIYDVEESGNGSLATNGQITGGVGINGLADAIETSADSGMLLTPPTDTDMNGIINAQQLDSDDDGCPDVTEAGFTDGDLDGILGSAPVSVDANGVVTSGTDGYTTPNADYIDDMVASACPSPPVAVADNDTVDEDSVDNNIDLAVNDTDLDMDLDIASIIIDEGPTSGGSVTVNLDGTIDYTPPMDFFGEDTIVYSICDMSTPMPLCDSDTVFITVNNIPDAPIAVLDVDIVNEDVIGAIVNVAGNDIDVDGDLDPATINIDVLPTSGGTATTNPDGTINYTPPPNFNGADTIIYSICDMTMPIPLCDSDTVFITVVPVPDPPNAVTDFDGAPENVTDAIVDLAGNDTDVDGDLDITSITIVGGPSSGGTAVPNPDGTITYNPPMSFNGVDTIIYMICDMTIPIPLCDTDTVFITVDSIPDPVDAMTDNETVDEDSTNDLDVLGNDVDPDFDIDPTSVVITDPTSGGTATVNPDGSINYTPPPNYFGSDTILYTVCDMTMPIPFCDSDTLFITVLSVPDAPDAVTDMDGAPEDVIDAIIDLAGNDSDVDGDLDIGSITIIGGPSSGGTAVPNPDGTITYNPPIGFSGMDTIIYSICDMTMPIPLCDTDTVFINVNSIPDPVDAITDNETVDEDSMDNVLDILGNDVDPDFDIDPTSVVISSPTSGGMATVNPDGSVNYTPPPNYFGLDTILYTVCDLTMPVPFCDSDTIFITVLSIPDPPDAVTDNAGAPENGNDLVIDVAGNDTDVDGDLDLSSVTVDEGPSSGGTAVPNPDGTITYNPPMGFNGVDTIVYTICDMTMPIPLCDTDTIFITVDNIPDPVDAITDNVTVDEDSTTDINVIGNDIDPDFDIDPTTVAITTPTSGGTAFVNPDGTINYTPPPNYFGLDTILYIVCDMTMPIPFCDTDTVFITVLSVPDAPDANTDITGSTENAVDVIIDAAENDTDVDGDLDLGSITIIGGPSSGGTAVPNPDGTITYNPPINFIGVDTIVYTICDMTMPIPLCDTDTIFITVDNIPDAPIAATDSTTTNEDTPLTDIDLSGNDFDIDGDLDPSSVSIILGPTSGGSISLNGDGSIDYFPPMDFNGVDTIIYIICDMTFPTPLCDTDTLFITVLPINDPPVAVDDAVVVFGQTPINVDVLDDDFDVDNDSIFITSAVSSVGGIVVFNPDGTIDYTAPADFCGTDTVTYIICDDGIPSLCDTAVVLIEVMLADTDGDGIPDAVETLTADTDGDGNPDFLELDSDDDSIPDEFEAMIDDSDPCNPTDPVDSDGDGMFDFQDEDSDADGIPDAVEAGPDGNNPVDTDGDGLWDYLDLDSDNDMIPDEVEAGSDPNNPVDTDGNGDPDYTDLDSDDDGIPDAVEAGSDPTNPVDTDGNGDPDYTDLDSDDDGIPDIVEAGPDGNNPVDTDGDGDADYQDLDSDDDTIPDSVEAGSDPNNPVDTDGNGDPDYTDLDSDDDGIPDEIEAGDDPNNPVDTDLDGDPDYQDLDSDNDTIPDSVEAGLDPNNPVDTDGDGDPDYQDLDSDDDTIPDSVEAGPDGNNPVDTDGNGDPDYTDLDSDDDGIPDEVEAGDDPNNPVDTDGNGDPDYQDLDSDDDEIPDEIEAGDDPNNPVDTDGDGDPDYQDLDSDADSILDGLADDEEALDDCDVDGIYDFRDPDPCDLTIPLGFSPGNGDMINEYWEINGLSVFPDHTLRIFNRWGQEVFTASPYNNDWNGESSEGILPSGTYYYILELNSDVIPNQAGWVYLNRE